MFRRVYRRRLIEDPYTYAKTYNMERTYGDGNKLRRHQSTTQLK